MYGLLFFFVFFGYIATMWFVGFILLVFTFHNTFMAVIVWPVGRRICGRWLIF